MATVAYVRVSTREQNYKLQVDAIKQYCSAYGIKGVKFESDKKSGANDRKRPGLKRVIAGLQSGKYNRLIVWKTDRIYRNAIRMLSLFEDWESRGTIVISITENLDITTPAGKLFVRFLAIVAEWERDVIRERTLAGMATAAANGRFPGRRPLTDVVKPAEISTALRKGKRVGMTLKQIAEGLGMSRTTLIRHKKHLQEASA